jgi:hypothetical protein
LQAIWAIFSQKHQTILVKIETMGWDSNPELLFVLFSLRVCVLFH